MCDKKSKGFYRIILFLPVYFKLYSNRIYDFSYTILFFIWNRNYNIDFPLLKFEEIYLRYKNYVYLCIIIS